MVVNPTGVAQVSNFDADRLVKFPTQQTAVRLHSVHCWWRLEHQIIVIVVAHVVAVFLWHSLNLLAIVMLKVVKFPALGTSVDLVVELLQRRNNSGNDRGSASSPTCC